MRGQRNSSAKEREGIAQYFESLPSQLKNTIKRKGKQLSAANGRIVIHRDEAGLDEALRAYEQVYDASWKNRESKSVGR